MSELQINKWKGWDINDKGFFISKEDDSGTIWVAINEFKDLKRLIKQIEKRLGVGEND